MVTNTVPLHDAVAESVLEMAAVGSAFKVVPKTRQLSPSQHEAKGLWTLSQYHSKHKRLILLIYRLKEFLFPFQIKWNPGVLVQPSWIRFESLAFCPFLTDCSTVLLQSVERIWLNSPPSSLPVKVWGHETILLLLISVGLHAVHPWPTARGLVGATRGKRNTWRCCLSISRKIVLWK